jgi:hypothetical protein
MTLRFCIPLTVRLVRPSNLASTAESGFKLQIHRRKKFFQLLMKRLKHVLQSAGSTQRGIPPNYSFWV